MARKKTLFPPEKAESLLDKHGYEKALKIAKEKKRSMPKDTIGMFYYAKIVKEIREFKT